MHCAASYPLHITHPQIPEKCESEDDARRRVTDKYGADSVAWGKEW